MAESIDFDNRTVSVVLDGHTHRFNRFWLRDNCPSEGDRASLFRDFTIDSMSPDLAIVSAALDGKFIEIGFSDGMTDRFSLSWLRDCAAAPKPPVLETWRSDHTMQQFSWADTDSRQRDPSPAARSGTRQWGSPGVGIARCRGGHRAPR